MARYKCPSCGAPYNGKRCRSCSYENFSDEISCSAHHKETVFDDETPVRTVPRVQPRQTAPQKTTPRPFVRKRTKGRNAKAGKTLRTLLIVYGICLLLNAAYGAFAGVREITSRTAILPEPSPETVSLPAEGTLLYDADGLVIMADWQDGQDYLGDISIVAENHTAQNLGISATDLVVNGYMMDLSYLYCRPEAGTAYPGALRLDEDELKNAGIGIVKEISFCLNIYDTDTYETIVQTDTITLRANAPEDYVQPGLEGGTLFWEGEGVSIRCLGYRADPYHTEDFLGGDFLFYIENNSPRTLNIYTLESRVNGEDANLSLWCRMLPGTRAVSRVYLYPLEDLDIDSLDNIRNLEFQLEIADADNWENTIETDMITVNFSEYKE